MLVRLRVPYVVTMAACVGHADLTHCAVSMMRCALTRPVLACCAVPVQVRVSLTSFNLFFVPSVNFSHAHYSLRCLVYLAKVPGDAPGAHRQCAHIIPNGATVCMGWGGGMAQTARVPCAGRSF